MILRNKGSLSSKISSIKSLWSRERVTLRSSRVTKGHYIFETFPFGILFHLIHQELNRFQWISRTFGTFAAFFQVHFHSLKKKLWLMIMTHYGWSFEVVKTYRKLWLLVVVPFLMFLNLWIHFHGLRNSPSSLHFHQCRSNHPKAIIILYISNITYIW